MMSEHDIASWEDEGGSIIQPMRFRKKPIVIEAVRFTGHNSAECLAFCPDAWTRWELPEPGPFLVIPTLEGDMKVSVGDWIIRGTKGEYYPCKPDIFDATYERVTSSEL